MDTDMVKKWNAVITSGEIVLREASDSCVGVCIGLAYPENAPRKR